MNPPWNAYTIEPHSPTHPRSNKSRCGSRGYRTFYDYVFIKIDFPCFRHLIESLQTPSPQQFSSALPAEEQEERHGHQDINFIIISFCWLDSTPSLSWLTEMSIIILLLIIIVHELQFNSIHSACLWLLFCCLLSAHFLIITTTWTRHYRC